MTWLCFAVFFIYIAYGSELQTGDIRTLTEKTQDSFQVSYQKWVYYNFTVPAHKGFTLKVEHSRGTTGTHDLDVFIRKGSLPDRSVYDYYDINIKTSISIDVLAEPVPTVFITGIYGFSGQVTYFSIYYETTNGCPQNCNRFGLCKKDNTCSCYSGHVGEYCQYNSTLVSLGKNYTGSLSANTWNYYAVDVFAANNLAVHVTQTEGGDVDLYLHYQTIPDFINYDYVDFSTAREYTIVVTEPLLGTWHLGFFAFSPAQYTFSVAEQRSCPMNCSLHGSCIGSVCHCNNGFSGLSCEEDTIPLNSSKVHGYVDLNFWNFYKYIANSDNPFLVKVTQKEKSANCDMYIMNSAKPTRFIYQYYNATLLSDFEISVNHPGLDVWWIGIYGSSSCEYDISVEHSTTAPCENCINGVCTNGVCNCNSGWVGSQCNVQPIVLSNGQRSSSFFVQNSQWKYFQITITNSSLLTVVMNEKITSGLAAIYAQKEDVPSLSSFESGDNTALANHRIITEFLSPKTHRYIIGVYGSPYIITPAGVEFSLVAFFTPF